MVEAEGFADWYRDQHPRLITTLTVVTGDSQLSAEAVDEAFVRALERWHRVAAMVSPAGWTYRTALNVLRRRRRRLVLEERLHRQRAMRDSAVSPPADWSPEVWDALRRLPERERTAVALRYVADLTTEDIARAMRIAPGTVGSTLHSARHRLSVALDSQWLDVEADYLQEVPDA